MTRTELCFDCTPGELAAIGLEGARTASDGTSTLPLIADNAAKVLGAAGIVVDSGCVAACLAALDPTVTAPEIRATATIPGRWVSFDRHTGLLRVYATSDDSDGGSVAAGLPGASRHQRTGEWLTGALPDTANDIIDRLTAAGFGFDPVAARALLDATGHTPDDPCDANTDSTGNDHGNGRQSAGRPVTWRELAAIPISTLDGVTDTKTAALNELGVHSVADLIGYYPRRWVDRTNEAHINSLVVGEEALVLVTVRTVASRTIGHRKTMVNVTVDDGTGRLAVTFFNQPWRTRQLTRGATISLYGKPEIYRDALQMTNPIVDLIGDQTGKIVPIYPQSDKAAISTWELAALIETAIDRHLTGGVVDPVPADIVARHGLIGRGDALRAIHQPTSMHDQVAARRRLAFDELLRVQTVLVARKRAVERSAAGIEHDRTGRLVATLQASLPYQLTGAQQRVIADIIADMASPQPMHRLLQGDVGAGKTLVAVSAMLTAVEGGYQAALMAPTEVLAEQHAAGIRRLLAGVTVNGSDGQPRPLRVESLTNRVTGADRRAVIRGIADGSVDIAIGTHALIQKAVTFHRLGLVAIDEQHRFGVEQRAALRDKATDGATPDVLVMTATPIPRTAAMTVYGDLDVSVLDELPPGRTPITTLWANGPLDEAAVWADVRAEITAGRQAYVVCPLVADSDKLELASAEATFDGLAAGELHGMRLALLHGKQTAAEKEQIMDMFRAGGTDVLVATTVIEVGVDVPNSTIIVILDADRFGIAQLHQLRGRVGRGRHPSRCWLVTQPDGSGSSANNPRIEALVASTDGFALSEIDLDLRGEGTIMGTAQKGASDLRLASLRTDRDLVDEARSLAFELVDPDTGLAGHPELADEIALLLSADDEAFLFKN